MVGFVNIYIIYIYIYIQCVYIIIYIHTYLLYFSVIDLKII